MTDEIPVPALPPVPPTGETVADPAVKEVARLPQEGWLGGVAAGLSAKLGWPVLVLRIFFLASSLWLFSGVALYAVLWLALPTAKSGQSRGVVAASRTGFRTPGRADRRLKAVIVLVLSLYGAGVGGLISLTTSNWIGRYAFPLVGLFIGGALIWQAWDQFREETSLALRWLPLAKVALGILIAFAAVLVAVGLRSGWHVAWGMAGVAGAALGLAAVLAGPWLLHTRRWQADREEELVEQAKADVAAHLHDSVLQTLAMIQRQSGDAKAVAQLARRQERELRQWLYGEQVDEASFVAALKAVAAEVEDTSSVPVDIVTVGEADLTPALDAVVRAAREAIFNAAKHSGAARIDVYSEITPGTAEVFVRDRGCGFDPAEVGEDRRGIRGSIIDRMQRYGGQASLRSTPGEGTEVRLEMAR